MIRFWRRLNWLMERKTKEAELQEEIEFHLESETEEREAGGLTREQARSEALRQFGSVTLHREDTRYQWGWRLLDELRRDLQFGLRNLRRTPGFTAVAVGALSIGAGSATAVFSIVNGILFEAFPYKDPQQLVLVFEHLPNAPAKFAVSPPDFQFFRERALSFSEMAAYRTVEYELSGVAESQRLIGARVSPELFSVLGVVPAIGRPITPEDNRRNATVAVLSHNLWSRFGRRTSIVGRTVLLDRRPYTVVGVMPEGFNFPPRGAELNGEPAELFVPMSFSRDELQGFGMKYGFTVVARLKPGVSVEQARDEMGRLTAPLVEQYPAVLQSFVSGISIPVVPLDEETLGRSRTMLLVLMGAVVMVLLIVCADVANLMLSRFGSRQREIAVRCSLGASPMRIVRQLLTESLTLGVLGSVLGLLFAHFAMRALSLGVETLPRAESIAFDHRILVFAILLALLTPLLFGALPALRSVSGTNAGTLKDSPRTATPGRGNSRLLATLAVTQISLALVLSVGAGLLVRSFLHLLSTDPGFRSEQSVRVTMTLPSGGYTTRRDVRTFYSRAIEAARSIPGVLAAGAGISVPLGIRERRAFTPEPGARPIPEPSRLIASAWVSPAYFEALGVPLKWGRFFSEGDRPRQPVVIINEMLAEMLWPDEDPTGRRIKWGIEASQSPWMTIVGVVGDVKQGTLDEPTVGQVYAPLSLLEASGYRTVNLIVRSSRDSESLIAELRGALQRLDPTLPITKAQPLSEMIGESLRPQRFIMTVVAFFAMVALTLAAIGIYGVLASVVVQQTREIAIRIALGATPAGVIWMVLRRTLVLVAAGIGLGLVGALGMTRVMASLLYEVRPTDAVAFLGAAVVLTLFAFLASLAPAWRATRVGPLVALKTD